MVASFEMGGKIGGRLAHEIGDILQTPEKATEHVHVGRCAGPYRRDPTVIGDAREHRSNDKWAG